MQRGFDVHVLDHNKTGPKPELARALGATYHARRARRPGDLTPDIIIECTGAPAVIADVLPQRGARRHHLPGRRVGSGAPLPNSTSALFNRNMVLNNGIVFGTVNANRAHYEMAADALARADRDWLSRLITRRVPLARWREAFEHRKDDIKVIVDFDA